MEKHISGSRHDPAFVKEDGTMMSPAEYEQAAINFIKQPIGGSITGFARQGTEGIEAIRYDRKTKLFGVGLPNGFVKTFLTLKYYNKDNTVNSNYKKDADIYYERQLKAAKQNKTIIE